MPTIPKPRPDHDPNPFRFLDLPKDIRLCVYERLPVTTHHCPLPTDKAETKETAHYICVVKTMPVAILATCRLINSEASSIVEKQLEKVRNRSPQMILRVANTIDVPDDISTLHSPGDWNGDCIIGQIMRILPKYHSFDHSILDKLGLYIPLKIKQPHYDLLWKFLAHAYRRHSVRTNTMDSPALQIAVDGLETSKPFWDKKMTFSFEGQDESMLDEIRIQYLVEAARQCRKIIRSAWDGEMMEFIPTYNERVAMGHPEETRIGRPLIGEFFPTDGRFLIGEPVTTYPIMPEATWINEWKEGAQFPS
ncbi:hypothetical protein DM02DRAFT_686369 [Periconia macrospinosa]|uniref:F-box domain-containing protein n=1 Tax=Periconia macrospinosa TaxID=97972 RepID=A0A2V1E4F2_9PLEO|nr:hypothetical protein DM02DRAFT_686369 [Periconia macrospinosa]